MSCRDPVRLGTGHKACCVTRPNVQVAVGGGCLGEPQGWETPGWGLASLTAGCSC